MKRGVVRREGRAEWNGVSGVLFSFDYLRNLSTIFLLDY